MIPGLGRSPGEGKGYPPQDSWASLVVELVKNLPAMQKTRVRSLGWEDAWRRAWQSTPAFLPGESHGQRSLGLQSTGSQRVRHNRRNGAHTHAGYLPPEWLFGEMSVQIFCLSISSSPYGPETLTPTSVSLHPHPWGLPCLYLSPIIITDSF